MTYPDPDDPAHPARPSVRPFLQSGPMSAGGYRPTPNGEPPADGVVPSKPFVLQHHVNDMLHPDSAAFLRRIRALVDEYPDRATLG